MVYAKWRNLLCNNQPYILFVLIDSALLKAARKVYRAYCETHPSTDKRPSGVVVNQINYQGKVLFSSQPVLLPQECFVPISQLESES